MNSLVQNVANALEGRKPFFHRTYDSSVWVQFELEGSDDMFHVMDGWAFGSTTKDADDRFVLDLNVDFDSDDHNDPAKTAASVVELLEDI
jgi:hypothetical protein